MIPITIVYAILIFVVLIFVHELGHFLAAKACGVPLELNLLGMREDRHYPNVEFWRVAAEENCAVVLGCDAHAPDEMHHASWEAQALQILRQLGLQRIEDPVIRKI